MESRSLELKVMSCNDLKTFNFFQKLSIYAVVSIVDGELKKKEQQQKRLQRQKTPIDREGGSNPEWNHVMLFDLKGLVDDCSHLFLSFDLHCEGVVYGNKTIGKVRVPLKDLIDEFNGAVRFLRYQVRSSDRKPNGVLNFSYKIKGKTINKGGTASSEVKLLPEVHRSNSIEKIHYPSLEDDEQSQDICYPSIDYAQSPLPGYCSPLPKYEYKARDVYVMTPPGPPQVSPAQLPPVMVSNGSFYHSNGSIYHQYPPPFVQTPGSWYMLESTGYDYNIPGPGGPGVPGQFGKVDMQTWKV